MQKNKNSTTKDEKKKEYSITYADGFFFPGGLQINWGSKKIGFGGLSFYLDKEMGRMVCDSEMMGPNFVSQVMAKLVEESIFPDFETHTKNVQSVSLEEVNALFPFREHILHTAFYVENDVDGKTFQQRWRLDEGKVLNIWFNRETVEAQYNIDEDLLSFDAFINDNKSFHLGFVKAEVWSWTREKKP